MFRQVGKGRSLSTVGTGLHRLDEKWFLRRAEGGLSLVIKIKNWVRSLLLSTRPLKIYVRRIQVFLPTLYGLVPQIRLRSMTNPSFLFVYILLTVSVRSLPDSHSRLFFSHAPRPDRGPETQTGKVLTQPLNVYVNTN